MENNWIYIGVFLDKESKLDLIRKFGKYIPEGWTTYCHHMTLVFNKHDDLSEKFFNYYKNRIGEQITLNIVGIGKSNDAIAFKVATNLKSTNKNTHITLAVPMGGKPVNSNYITNWQTFETPVTATGEIQMYMKK